MSCTVHMSTTLSNSANRITGSQQHPILYRTRKQTLQLLPRRRGTARTGWLHLACSLGSTAVPAWPHMHTHPHCSNSGTTATMVGAVVQPQTRVCAEGPPRNPITAPAANYALRTGPLSFRTMPSPPIPLFAAKHTYCTLMHNRGKTHILHTHATTPPQQATLQAAAWQLLGSSLRLSCLPLFSS